MRFVVVAPETAVLRPADVVVADARPQPDEPCVAIGSHRFQRLVRGTQECAQFIKQFGTMPFGIVHTIPRSAEEPPPSP